MGNRRRRWRLLGALLGSVVMVSGAPADEGDPGSSQTNLVKQANAPISSVLQIRLQDGYAPEFTDLHGRGNVFTIAATMPLPEYRLLPLPQLSLLSVPAAVTLPGGTTGFGDVRFGHHLRCHAPVYRLLAWVLARARSGKTPDPFSVVGRADGQCGGRSGRG